MPATKMVYCIIFLFLGINEKKGLPEIEIILITILLFALTEFIRKIVFTSRILRIKAGGGARLHVDPPLPQSLPPLHQNILHETIQTPHDIFS